MRYVGTILAIYFMTLGTLYAGDQAVAKYVEDQLNKSGLDSEIYNIEGFSASLYQSLSLLESESRDKFDSGFVSLLRMSDESYLLNQPRPSTNPFDRLIDDIGHAVYPTKRTYKLSSISAGVIFRYFSDEVNALLFSEEDTRENLLRALYHSGLRAVEYDPSIAEDVISSLTYMPVSFRGDGFENERRLLSSIFLNFEDNALGLRITEENIDAGNFSLDDTFVAWKLWFVDNKKGPLISKIILHKKYGLAGVPVLRDLLLDDYTFDAKKIAEGYIGDDETWILRILEKIKTRYGYGDLVWIIKLRDFVAGNTISSGRLESLILDLESKKQEVERASAALLPYSR